jgi:stearoyl-CoA desaturase (Delta-9 desaturase)
MTITSIEAERVPSPLAQAPISAKSAESADSPGSTLQRAITGVLVVGPLVGVVFAITMLFGRGVSLFDLILAVSFYAIAGHGVTVGFHRLFTHRSFKAGRGLKILLAVAGSMAFEGSVNSWVANHRRHHAFTDRRGDPHSPYLAGTSWSQRIRGGLHAHIGWLFQAQPTDETRWAGDLTRDRDMVIISRLFPVLCLISLGLPALIGWIFTGTGSGALEAFLWAGLVRVFVLHHSTFAVNSVCHIWGQRPDPTRKADRSTNFAPLAILSMGESWHNTHHSNPCMARVGRQPGQLDSSARVIRMLEAVGLAHNVRWSPALRLS